MRQDRASSDALALLKGSFIAQKLPLSHGTFRIVMSTCVRDKNNHNSLRTGSEILGIMATVYEDYDAKTVTMYADLALSFPSAKGSDLVNALTFLRPAIQSFRIQLGVATAESRGEGMYRPKSASAILSADARDDAIAALRKIYALMSKLLHSELLPEDQKPPFEKERAKLSAYLNRLGFQQGTIKWDGPKRDGVKGTRKADEAGDPESGPGMDREKPKDRDVTAFPKPTGAWRERKAGQPAGTRRPWSSPTFSDAA